MNFEIWNLCADSSIRCSSSSAAKSSSDDDVYSYSVFFSSVWKWWSYKNSISTEYGWWKTAPTAARVQWPMISEAPADSVTTRLLIDPPPSTVIWAQLIRRRRYIDEQFSPSTALTCNENACQIDAINHISTFV